MKMNGSDVSLITELEIRKGYSPYIGENGNWWEYNNVSRTFVDTGVNASVAVSEQGLVVVNGKLCVVYDPV